MDLKQYLRKGIKLKTTTTGNNDIKVGESVGVKSTVSKDFKSPARGDTLDEKEGAAGN